MQPTLDEIDRLRNLFARRKFQELECMARQLIAKYPNSGFAWKALGLSLLDQGKDALSALTKAVELLPEDPSAHSNLGVALNELGEHEKAIVCYQDALRIQPNHPEALYNLGCSQRSLGQTDAAAANFQHAIKINPEFADPYVNFGLCLASFGQINEAIASYQQALKINPNIAEAFNNMGIALKRLKRNEEALDCYRRALEIRPHYADAHCNVGNILKSLQQFDNAKTSYLKTLELQPGQAEALAGLIDLKLITCDWSNLEDSIDQFIDIVQHHNRAAPPFDLLACSNSAAFHKKLAELFVHARYPTRHKLGEMPRHSKTEKIHIAYFSADFHNHATTYLVADLLEHHDKSKFEITAFSFGPDCNDAMRQRITKTFDHFLCVKDLSDIEVAKQARDMRIDIAIDLKGFTQDCRPGIFALRAAPIQVNYLGYPATMGAEYIDYLIADPTLIPESHLQNYSEKIVFLPHSYQPNDRKRRISNKDFSRQELGLPDEGFVFCCFNNNYKILPKTFDSWMRILNRTANSVLWLYGINEKAANNLRDEARARGISPERLIFAQKMPLAEHLARHRLADLFLDTLPYNAHTTASDALWAGLPVLTCPGETFAGRVAASLLNAIHLPELITDTTAEYEDQAVELAKNPEKLTQLKQKLTNNRLTTPLFDSQLFAWNIESAYEKMYEKYQENLLPNHIYVENRDDLCKLRDLIVIKNYPEAEWQANKLIAERTDSTFAWKVLSLSLLKQGKNALFALKKVAELLPNDMMAHISLGNEYTKFGQNQEAVASFLRALKIQPANYVALFNLGCAQKSLNLYDSAADSFGKVIEVKPDFADAHLNLGICFACLGLLNEALTSYEHALEIKPSLAEAHNNKGIVLRRLERQNDALASYREALKIRPNYLEALCNLGNAQKELGQLDEAAVNYQKSLQLQPNLIEALAGLIEIRMKNCEWNELENSIRRAFKIIELQQKAFPPFTSLVCSNSPSLNKTVAKIFVQTKYPAHHLLPSLPKQPKSGKIKIGYFSADFHNHATTYLLADLFEKHDRSKFELSAFSFGPNSDDEMRKRIATSFDYFIDVKALSDEEIAKRSRAMGIDIAIDLKGFTQDSRAGIFAFRAAPLQVSYLGYPGTMGAEYIDYLIADPTLIPDVHLQYYTEEIIYLPNSYQANDRKRAISGRKFTRAELELPDQSFVFCCFNNNYKILPDTFDCWMRILNKVENSVLWLLKDNPTAAKNLRKETQLRGINPERLIFAPRMPLSEHLARHRLADLFLDTLPCNAHTTTSDALWAGLPVLTCLGETFAGRVAASLLNAIRLPELITNTTDEYEALAIELANNPAKLINIKQKLASNRLTTPLFDSTLFTKHIEAAYSAIYERYQQGLPPETLHIPD